VRGTSAFAEQHDGNCTGRLRAALN
jgi:hypothetical protein